MTLVSRWIRRRARQRLSYARAVGGVIGWVICPRCYGEVNGPLLRHLHLCPRPLI